MRLWSECGNHLMIPSQIRDSVWVEESSLLRQAHTSSPRCPLHWELSSLGPPCQEGTGERFPGQAASREGWDETVGGGEEEEGAGRAEAALAGAAGKGREDEGGTGAGAAKPRRGDPVGRGSCHRGHGHVRKQKKKTELDFHQGKVGFWGSCPEVKQHVSLFSNLCCPRNKLDKDKLQCLDH